MFKEQQTSLPDYAFFPIPNPNPLLRSFNIPEPVIHPPGTDPYSFLNPNPHGDDRLEPLPALDVDPSAASWSEVITRTTDLTASEHAGGTLSDPTMVSTTSHSPANSEVVAQQTVNDATVTKIQSKNTQSILCDVCNITCNSEDVLKRHKKGKKHLNNMQKLAVSSAITQEMPPPVADATLYQESEKKHDLLQNEASVDSLFVCDIPDVGCNIQNIFTKHLEGEKHTAQVTSGSLCRDGLPNPTSVSTPPVQPSNSGTQKAQEKLNVCQFVWCEVCKVSCSSNKILSRHVLGKKHLKNLKNSGKILAQSSTPIASMATTPITKPVENSKSTEVEIVDSEEGKPAWCELNKVSCSSNILSRHLSAKKHLKNLQKSEKIPGSPSIPIASVITPSTGPAEKPKSTKGEVVNSKEVKSARCELCGICCNSYDELHKHILGKKHRKNVKKYEKFFGPSPAPAAERSLQDPRNEEGKVVILERCKRKANGSLASHEDPDTKKQKMMKEEAASGSLITCRLCNVVCNSLMAFTTHLAGHKHSAMALKQVKAGSNEGEV